MSLEFPGLGEHCDVKDCHILDFLPFTCDGCGKKHCLDHRNYNDHNCPTPILDRRAVRTVECPICSTEIFVKKDQSPDDLVNAHIMEGCPKPVATKKPKSEKIYASCSYPRCKVKEFMPESCGGCHRKFCLKHRYADVHHCKDYVREKRLASVSAYSSSSSSSTPSRSIKSH